MIWQVFTVTFSTEKKVSNSQCCYNAQTWIKLNIAKFLFKMCCSPAFSYARSSCCDGSSNYGIASVHIMYSFSVFMEGSGIIKFFIAVSVPCMGCIF
jgi:hypothetical protein